MALEESAEAEQRGAIADADVAIGRDRALGQVAGQFHGPAVRIGADQNGGGVAQIVEIDFAGQAHAHGGRLFERRGRSGLRQSSRASQACREDGFFSAGARDRTCR